jgi:hypothetical protein
MLKVAIFIRGAVRHQILHAHNAKQGLPQRKRNRKKKKPGIRRASKDDNVAGQLLLQTVMVFMPASASVRVLKAIGPTCTTLVVVGFLSTMVHLFVAVSCTM